MKRARLLHVLLAVIGIAALTAYLVACRPSWSPDGSQVMFTYCNLAAQQQGIALYDRETNETEILYTLPFHNAPDTVKLWSQWAGDGKHAIIFVPAGEELHILRLPVGAEKPDRDVRVKQDAAFALIGAPAAELRGKLFVGSRPITRIDLETKEIKRGMHDGEAVLISSRDRLLYLAGGEDGQTLEAGTVDPDDLSLSPWRQLRQAELGEINPFFAAASDGSAIVAASKKDQQFFLWRIAKAKLDGPVALKAEKEIHQITNLQWSSDKKTVYAGIALKIRGQSLLQLGVGEIAFDTGRVRVTPLLRIPPPSEDAELVYDYQISLSPDGKTVAASPTYLSKFESEKDRALYLVDLTASDRKVTKIPFPARQKSEG